MALAACAAKKTPEPMAAPPLVVEPLDAGPDVAPRALPRRWFEYAFFDALGTVVRRAPKGMFENCFERSSDRGYAMLLRVNESWTTEDANGLERETIACLKNALEHDDPNAEKATRVYVVFR